MHRWISEDDARHCFACGLYDESEDGAGSMLPCIPGGWKHPPYVLGCIPDGPMGGLPYIETCAAHPYECQSDPTRKAEWEEHIGPHR